VEHAAAKFLPPARPVLAAEQAFRTTMFDPLVGRTLLPYEGFHRTSTAIFTAPTVS